MQLSRQSTLQTIHVLGHSAFIYVGLHLAYAVALVALGRWLSRLLKFGIVLQRSRLLSQFRFQKQANRPYRTGIILCSISYPGGHRDRFAISIACGLPDRELFDAMVSRYPTGSAASSS
jgi:hypothetical protein